MKLLVYVFDVVHLLDFKLLHIVDDLPLKKAIGMAKNFGLSILLLIVFSSTLH